MVQLNFSPENKVFYILFERSRSISSMASLKQHMEYFQFHCNIQLDLPEVFLKNLTKDPKAELKLNSWQKSVEPSCKEY